MIFRDAFDRSNVGCCCCGVHVVLLTGNWGREGGGRWRGGQGRRREEEEAGVRVSKSNVQEKERCLSTKIGHGVTQRREEGLTLLAQGR